MQAATELASWESKYSHLVPIYILIFFLLNWKTAK